jgi:hypothetical protein
MMEISLAQDARLTSIRFGSPEILTVNSWGAVSFPGLVVVSPPAQAERIRDRVIRKAMSEKIIVRFFIYTSKIFIMGSPISPVAKVCTIYKA